MEIKKIKLGFYCSSTSWGGLEMNFVQHAKWLTNKDIHTEIYCVKNSPIYEEFQNTGWTVTTVLKNKKYVDMPNALKVSKLLKKDEIDVLWVADNRDLSLVHFIKKVLGYSFKIIYRQAMRLGVAKKDFLHTQKFRVIDIWICTLPYMSEEVQRNTKVNSKKIRVVPLGVEMKSIESVTPDKSREKFNWPKDKLVLGIIGRVDRHKGQLFVVKQMPTILKRFPNTHLAIVGESTKNEGDEYLVQIRNFIEENQLNESISIHPFLKKKEKFYRSVDIVLVPSEAETFGMVTIEAMHYGCSILGTNTAGTPEILGNGEYGLVYTPNDEKEFLSQLSKLMEVETRNAIGLRAKSQADLVYSKDGFCKAVIKILEEL